MPQWFPVTPEPVRIILGQKVSGAESQEPPVLHWELSSNLLAIAGRYCSRRIQVLSSQFCTPTGSAMGWDCTNLMETKANPNPGSVWSKPQVLNEPQELNWEEAGADPVVCSVLGSSGAELELLAWGLCRAVRMMRGWRISCEERLQELGWALQAPEECWESPGGAGALQGLVQLWGFPGISHLWLSTSLSSSLWTGSSHFSFLWP